MAQTKDTKTIDPARVPTLRGGEELDQTLGKLLVEALDKANEIVHGPNGPQPKQGSPEQYRKRNNLANAVEAAAAKGETLTMTADQFALSEQCVAWMWPAHLAGPILAAMGAPVEGPTPEAESEAAK